MNMPESNFDVKASKHCDWATETSKFFKGTKPVDFSGDHWKL